MILNINNSVAGSYVQTFLPVLSSPVLPRKALLSHSRRRVVIMTTIVFVPEWNATPEMVELANSRKDCREHFGIFRYFDIKFSAVDGCDVIQLTDNRVETMPECLRDVPMRSIRVVKQNSPVTDAVDGPYKDDRITARVETYVGGRFTQQSIKVVGINGTTIEELNQWFDDLTAGKKADKNTNPITYPTTWVSSSSNSGETLLGGEE
jgi:hypothetical protein